MFAGIAELFGTSATPQEDEPLPQATNLKDVPAESEDAVDGLLQQFSVLLEYEWLQDLLPMGVYLLIGLDSLHVWYGTIFVRSGYYRGGIFKFMIKLSEDYPEIPPEIIFTSDMFHPLVNPQTGRFQLEVFFPRWTAGRDYVSGVIPHLHRALLRRDYLSRSSKPVNAEALKLFESNPEAFAARCKQCVDVSLKDLYQNHPNTSFQFTRRPEGAHEHILQQLRKVDASAHDLKEATNEFADWFIDHYAKQNCHINVGDDAANTETIAIPPRSAELVDEPEAEGFAPAKGWGSSGTAGYERSADDNEQDDALDPQLALYFRAAQNLQKAKDWFAEGEGSATAATKKKT